MSTPRTSSTSPTLKTLWTGHEAGSAKTSPSGCSLASSTAIEFLNSDSEGANPAMRSAEGDAGMTPPLAAIAAKFASPPMEAIASPGTRRLSHANVPATP